MTAQPTLFDAPAGPRARNTDPHTSRAAARTAQRGVPNQILEVMATEPGWAWTADELAARLPLVRCDTLRSALSRLRGQGRVRAAGTAVSAAGCPMTRWVRTERNG
jgi:hypothetical protein